MASLVTSPFGPRRNPFGGTPQFHRGIDVDGDTGDPIFACRAGRVVQVDVVGVGAGKSNGNAIHILDPYGYTWVYKHLSKAGVTRGDQVARGELIGLMGSTGTSTGSHLHLQLEYAGKPIDPLPFFPPGTFRRRA